MGGAVEGTGHVWNDFSALYVKKIAYPLMEVTIYISHFVQKRWIL